MSCRVDTPVGSSQKSTVSAFQGTLGRWKENPEFSIPSNIESAHDRYLSSLSISFQPQYLHCSYVGEQAIKLVM